MDAGRESEPTPVKHRTTVERKSERELVVTRTFNGPARIVFEAWTTPTLLKRWWAPKSTGVSLLSCEADVRVGGRYLEVTPHSRLVWTNDESDDGAIAGMPAGMPETFAQLDELLVTLGASVGRS